MDPGATPIKSSPPAEPFVTPQSKNVSRVVGSTASKQEQCSICWAPMLDSENVILTRCKHHFHETCLLQAKERRSDCPLCRGALTPVATTITPVVYYEFTIPVEAQARLASRFEDLDESIAPSNPLRDEIAANSRRVRETMRRAHPTGDSA